MAYQKIERAYLIYISIWNDGNQPIDTKDIPPSQPIFIKSKNSIQILDVKSLSKRPSLGLTATSVDSAKNNHIRVSWNQDEVLELNEGGTIRILYAAKNSTTFYVEGRVKGAPQGFIKSSSIINSSRLTGWSSIVQGFVLIELGVWLPFSFKLSTGKTWEKIHRFSTADEYVQHSVKKSWAVWIIPV